MKFPVDTLEIMINRCSSPTNHTMTRLRFKLNEISVMDDIYEKNRLFGYYQHVGETMGLWTSGEIMNLLKMEQ